MEGLATSCCEGWRQAKSGGAALLDLIPLSLCCCFLPSPHVPVEPVNVKRPLLPWECLSYKLMEDLGRSEYSNSTGLSRGVLVPYHLHSVILGDKTLGWMILPSVPGGSLLCCTPNVKCLWPLTCSCVNALCLQLSHQSYALRPEPCLGL